MVRKGAKLYFAASLVAQASALVRYVVLARLLGPEQLGLAAMLILTAQFFDSISDTGSDRFIVQDPEGDSPHLQGLVQLVLAGRGVLIALALVVSSGLMAALYRAPQIAPSLMELALVPLIAGFGHLDVRRAQRSQDFRPESIATITSEIAGTIGTGVAAWITRDHSAIVYGLVLRAITWVVASHLVATRAYRWAFVRADMIRFSSFAAPLFLNGLLLFLGSQGDRLIVGSGLGAAALGHYSAILLLVYYPASTASKFVAGIHLPQLAAARESAPRYAAAEDRLGGRTVLLSVAMIAGFAVVGPVVTPLLYGKAFAQPLQIFALLAVLQAGRLLRIWPTTVAVSLGRSAVVMWNNVARMIALPVAFGANLYFHSLEAIISGFIVGELAALAVALVLLGRDAPTAKGRELVHVAVYLSGSALVVAWSWGLQLDWLVALPVLAIASLAALVATWRSEAAVIDDTLGMVRQRLTRLRRA